jgi:hypothetical protein
MTQEVAKDHNYTIEIKDEVLIVKNKNSNSDIEMEVILFDERIIKMLNEYERNRELDRVKHHSIIKNIIDFVKGKFE